MQKWAAQRTVQDREPQFKSVEEILAEAVTANAQLAVARSVVERMGRAEGKTETDIAAEVAEIEEAMMERLVFGEAKSHEKEANARKPAFAVRPDCCVTHLPHRKPGEIISPGFLFSPWAGGSCDLCSPRAPGQLVQVVY